jgi:hypothetical protein
MLLTKLNMLGQKPLIILKSKRSKSVTTDPRVIYHELPSTSTSTDSTESDVGGGPISGV